MTSRKELDEYELDYRRYRDRLYYAENREKLLEKGKIHHKLYYINNKERLNKINRESYYRNKEKRLKKIKEYCIKNREKRNLTTKLWRKNNSEKMKLYYKQYREKNKATINLTKKEYRLNNKEKFKQYKNNYYLKNKAKVLESQRIRLRLKRQTNPLFKLRERISNHINFHLKRVGLKKRKPTWKLLNYTASDLKNHLEKQFNAEMSWENYGSYWHIDHIIPISSFKTEQDLIEKGYALENLQPLSKDVNMKKSNKYIFKANETNNFISNPSAYLKH